MTPHTYNGTKAPPLAREVLACFVHNPWTIDSLEGIARFRLQQDTVHQTVDQVSEALRWLVDHELLQRETSAGKSPLFRLNPDQVDAAERFLKAEVIGGRARTSEVAESEGRASDIRTNGAAAAPPRSRPLENDATLDKRVRTWLDATLMLHHRRQPSGQDDVPGFSRSGNWLENVLGASDCEPSANELDAKRAVDEATRSLAEGLECARDTAPLARLQRCLELDFLELRALLLCFATELDPKYQVVFGIFNDDLSRRWMTLGLCCALLGEPLVVRRELTGAGGLLAWSVLDCQNRLPYADEPLRVDPVLVAWLLGDHAALCADARLEPLDNPRPGAAAALDESGQRLDEALDRTLRHCDWAVLCDDRASDALACLADCRDRLDEPLLQVDLGVLGERPAAEAKAFGVRVARALKLTAAVPVFDLTSATAASLAAAEPLFRALNARGCAGVAVVGDPRVVLQLLSHERWHLLRRRRLDLASGGRLYAERARRAGLALNEADAEWLALTFPLAADAIDRAVTLAAATGPGADDSESQRVAIARACGRVASPELPRFARRIEATQRIADVVLPPDRHAQLLEIVAHVRCAPQVLERWGFAAQLPYGRGVAALFHGPSGTGKTMAAHAIAVALGTDVYVVDLSQVVSKYIGESEKNLDAVFKEAERSGAVLLFDEADALFGKRSEIKDAHDRYANIEVAYLLQRMEAYAGLAILTTNYRQNVDQAFLRRLRFVVEFPRPDARAREQIWRKCLPGEAPLASDIDLGVLARRLDITGGHINLITTRAAFSAAHEGAAAIGMRHIIKASLAELRKLGMPTAERDLVELDTLQRRAQACAV
jgi:hypothetical protein